MLAFLWLNSAFAQELETGAALVGAVANGVNETPVSTAVRLLLTLSALSFLPAMLVVMTPFVRFIIVFSMLRQALGMAQSPPNQVLIGLSLFLSQMVMEPTLTVAYHQGLEPFLAGQMQVGDAWDATLEPLRGFMLANTRKTDMLTILQVANQDQLGQKGDGLLMDLGHRLEQRHDGADHQRGDQHRSPQQKHHHQGFPTQFDQFSGIHRAIPWTMSRTSRPHPSVSTKIISLKGREMVVGGNIIMPMPNSTLLVTRSMTRKGMKM